LNQRGTREHQLLMNIRRNTECCTEAVKKPIPESLELEEPENYEKVEMLPYGCPAPDAPGENGPLYYTLLTASRDVVVALKALRS